MGQRPFTRQLFIAHETFCGHRTHQQVAQTAQQQKAGENVQGRVVGLTGRHTVGQLELTDVVDHHRSEDAGHGPRRQQTAMDGTHMLRAEQISQISRDGGKAAAVHGENDAEQGDEQRHLTRAARRRRCRIKRDAQQEEHEVRGLAADDIGKRGPEDTAQDVEQR